MRELLVLAVGLAAACDSYADVPCFKLEDAWSSVTGTIAACDRDADCVVREAASVCDGDEMFCGAAVNARAYAESSAPGMARAFHDHGCSSSIEDCPVVVGARCIEHRCERLDDECYPAPPDAGLPDAAPLDAAVADAAPADAAVPDAAL